MTTTLQPSRRLFLRQASAFSSLGVTAAPMALNLAAMGSASAQSASDYKALVCIFLFGGNDSFNTVLATDQDSWTHYGAVRNQLPDSIALLAPGTPVNGSAAVGTPARLGGVLPIRPTRPQGRSFALHPVMASLQGLFNDDKRLAIVSNVGPLIMPTSKAQYANASYPKPFSLFSHNDQQNTWQALQPEGATKGWGGRMSEMLASSNGKANFTSISASGNAVWLAGQTVRQYQLAASGAIRLGAEANGRLFSSADVQAALERIVSTPRSTHLFEKDVAATARRSIDAEASLRSVLKPASDPRFGTPASTYDPSTDPRLQYDNPLTGKKTFNSLAQQLQVIARMIEAGPSVGLRRQVMFVSMGGFDTHDGQNRTHTDCLARLAHAMSYFDATLDLIGARQQVTTFTASDFGRSFTSNGDGTDHGWGAHHFVMGGAVKGGDIYGNFPTLGAKNASNNNFDSSPNQLVNGALLPEVSVDQLGATLGKWFGLNASQLGSVFPNLANFNTAVRDLGFMA